MSAAGLSRDPRRWPWHAGEDLATAERFVGHSAATPRHACTFAQQAAEKALGAALVYSSIDVPVSQDLNALLSLIPADWRVRTEHPDLDTLSGWSVDAQRREGWTDSANAQAQQAIWTARAVLESVLRDLRDHDIDVAPYR